MSDRQLAIVYLETIAGRKLTAEENKKIKAMSAEEARAYADRQWERFMKQPVQIQVNMEDLYNVIIAFDAQSVLLKNSRNSYKPGSVGFKEYADSLKESEANMEYWINIRNAARSMNPLELEEVE